MTLNDRRELTEARQTRVIQKTCRRLTVVALAAAFGLPSAPVIAEEPGMFLCRSPVVANDFWNDLLAAKNTGIQLNHDLAASIARKNACAYQPSRRLRPINFVAGQMEITDGQMRGWASPYLYILYVNRPDMISN